MTGEWKVDMSGTACPGGGCGDDVLEGMVEELRQGLAWHERDGAERALQLKSCPECGAVLFADMAVCFRCMGRADADVGRWGAGADVQEGGLRTGKGVGLRPFGPEERHRTAGTEKERRRSAGSWEEVDPDETVCLLRPTCSRSAPEEPSGTWNIRCRGGQGRAEEYVLPCMEGLVLNIGRARDNDIVIADHTVSRHHARLSVREGKVWVEDLGSRNHSFLSQREAGVDGDGTAGEGAFISKESGGGRFSYGCRPPDLQERQSGKGEDAGPSLAGPWRFLSAPTPLETPACLRVGNVALDIT